MLDFAYCFEGRKQEPQPLTGLKLSLVTHRMTSHDGLAKVGRGVHVPGCCEHSAQPLVGSPAPSTYVEVALFFPWENVQTWENMRKYAVKSWTLILFLSPSYEEIHSK